MILSSKFLAIKMDLALKILENVWRMIIKDKEKK